MYTVAMQIRHVGGTHDGMHALSTAAIDLRDAVVHLRTIYESDRYEDPAASINLPGDQVVMDAVTQYCEHFKTPALREVFVIGIGGSSLGAEAVYDALKADLTGPRLHFLDAVNPLELTHAISYIAALRLEEVLVISISKSGGTTETIANTEVVLAELKKKGERYRDRLVVITDHGSAYAKAAEGRGIAVLAIPPAVGGRYSVFSAAGLFPLALAGVDIAALRSGADDTLRVCLNPNEVGNPAMASAVMMQEMYRAGFVHHTMFCFAPELESVGKWWRQLIGESLGKVNRSGEPVGPIPSVSVGSQDLHSVGQLYFGGPRNTYTLFVSVGERARLELPSAEEREFPEIVPIASGQSLSQIGHAILAGTMAAYEAADLPYSAVLLPQVTAYELGSFLEWAMVSTMYAGHLFAVNPFDQPHVEAYKVKTREILETESSR